VYKKKRKERRDGGHGNGILLAADECITQECGSWDNITKKKRVVDRQRKRG